MSQNGNIFTAFWMNTATAPGTPLTGLSATINIRDLSGTLVINAEAMTEIGGGWYLYTFASYDNQKEYVYDCNPGATAYRESGVTDKRLDYIDKSLSSISGGIAGYRSSPYDFGMEDRLNLREIKKFTEKPIDFSDIHSHILLAKDETIGTIESIEMPEFDTTNIVKSIGVIKAQNTKIANYIKGNEDKEKQDMEAKHTNMMAEMETAYAEMEKANGTEKEDIISSADEIIAMLEDENKSVGDDTLAKIKTLLK